jgi:hypothetical protein
LGVDRFELVAPDLQSWGAATNPTGMITGWLLRKLGVDAMVEMFASGLDDDASHPARRQAAHDR